MKMSPRLTQAITLAKRAIQVDPEGDLRLGYRRAIYSALGTRASFSTSKNERAGYARRFSLALTTVEKVISLWQQRIPEDSTPTDALDIARSIEQGRLEEEKGWTEHGRLWAHLDDLSYLREDLQVTIAVGYAAVQTIAVALCDEQFEPEEDLGVSDRDVDPHDLDTACLSAAAYSDGPIWLEGSSAERRRQFWEWWLKCAVPAAMEGLGHGKHG